MRTTTISRFLKYICATMASSMCYIFFNIFFLIFLLLLYRYSFHVFACSSLSCCTDFSDLFFQPHRFGRCFLAWKTRLRLTYWHLCRIFLLHHANGELFVRNGVYRPRRCHVSYSDG